MNKHIALVKKWLANPDSVTEEELSDNVDVAAKTDAAAYIAASAATYAYLASNATNSTNSTNAEYWLKRYEELTK